MEGRSDRRPGAGCGRWASPTTARPAGILGDEELIKVIGNFPLRTLIAFTGLGITEDVVSQMTARFAPSETD